MPKESVYFISDAHFGAPVKGPDRRLEKFTAFLESIGPRARALYLVGDIFDFWYEYRTVVPSESFEALAALHRLVRGGTPVHYIGGNHDFWHGDFLSRTVGMQINFNPVTVTLGSRTVHIRHGHEFLRQGLSGWLLKKILRNRINGRLYQLIHPDLGIPFAKFVSRLSRRCIDARLDIDRVVADYRRAARTLLTENPWDALIVAHTHKADFVEHGDRVYLNTGNWMKDFNYVVFENDRFSLQKFE
jgi:UDP-2,3-diacylglucosamine hydrolase